MFLRGEKFSTCGEKFSPYNINFYPKWKCLSPGQVYVTETFVLVCIFVYYIYITFTNSVCLINKRVTFSSCLS